MNSDILIKVENLSKKFCKNLKGAILYGAKDITKNILGMQVDSSYLRNNEFWSVKDVSFEVRRGECLGLIGPNGAGKSTMLKILNGLYPPDKGRVTMFGRIGALIELGAGFHPILTGRENIYIYGAIRGMSKKEIDRRFDEIVEFAELEDFIDMPVKYYSSGMFVRLGFAVIAQMKPDVFLIDEVLAVGDVGFRARCYNYVAEVNTDAAVVFVSHAMPQIARICDRVIVMDHGEKKFDGDVPGGIDSYRSLFEMEKSTVTGTGEAKIHFISLSGKEIDGLFKIEYGREFNIDFNVTVDKKYPEFNVSVTFISQDLQLIAQAHSLFSKSKLQLQNTNNPMDISIKIPQLMLNPGKYGININIYEKNNKLICLFMLE